MVQHKQQTQSVETRRDDDAVTVLLWPRDNQVLGQAIALHEARLFVSGAKGFEN